MIDRLTKISKAGIWFSISGMLTVAFIYCIWGLGEDIYSEFKEYKLETAYSSDDVYSKEVTLVKNISLSKPEKNPNHK